MPEMDGTDLCRHIRMEADTPVIFLSSMDDEVDRIVGLDSGAGAAMLTDSRVMAGRTFRARQAAPLPFPALLRHRQLEQAQHLGHVVPDLPEGRHIPLGLLAQQK